MEVINTHVEWENGTRVALQLMAQIEQEMHVH